eukprot:TRINITY_DN77941_c0_g1_i1.p1 TRINITY_DN77941_c0_g1~~TRINITY_DN77941_c0_g1_i1.p1  ORF type:complete len:181 (+),score=25.78 TRINITY_DN77941_c0_g1_i1:32-544(+)
MDSQLVATGGIDATAKVWNSRTGKCSMTLQHDGPVYTVAFSPSDALLLSGSLTRAVMLWSTQTGEMLGSLQDHDSRVFCAVFCADGKSILAGTESGSIKLWDAELKTCMLDIIGHQSAVQAVAFLPELDMLVSGFADGSVRLWNRRTGELAKTFACEAGPPARVLALTTR